jgi:hypothetical protein
LGLLRRKGKRHDSLEPCLGFFIQIRWISSLDLAVSGPSQLVVSDHFWFRVGSNQWSVPDNFEYQQQTYVIPDAQNDLQTFPKKIERPAIRRVPLRMSYISRDLLLDIS